MLKDWFQSVMQALANAVRLLRKIRDEFLEATIVRLNRLLDRLANFLTPDYGIDEHPSDIWRWDGRKKRWVFRNPRQVNYNCTEYLRARIEGPSKPPETGFINAFPQGKTVGEMELVLIQNGFVGPYIADKAPCVCESPDSEQTQSETLGGYDGKRCVCAVVYQSLAQGSDPTQDSSWASTHVAVQHRHGSYCDWAGKRSGFFPIEHFQHPEDYYHGDDAKTWRMLFYCRNTAPLPEYSDVKINDTAIGHGPAVKPQ